MKAMLIIDMPETCSVCPCAYITQEEKNCLAMDVLTIDVDEDKEKPTWCPLRPVPTLKEDNSVIYIPEYDGYLEGWNDCVREILGGGRE